MKRNTVRDSAQCGGRCSVRPVWGLTLAGVLFLGACSQVPNYVRPVAPMPEAFAAPTGMADADGAPGRASAVAVDAEWWQRFASPELDRLVQEALAANHDLAAATQRVLQARASLGQAASILLPTVGANVGGSATGTLSNGQLRSSYADSAGLTMSYEVDLFAANRAGKLAAAATLQSQQYARASVALALQASVATAYLQALAIQDRLGIAERNLEAASELLRLVEVRLANGSGTALEYAQQKTAVLGIQATMPDLRQALAETLHGLAILLGQAPTGFTIRGASLAAVSLPEVEPGLPVALLERRPDLQQAEYALISANADVGAARAALYPSLSLSASAGVQGVLTGGLATVAELAASLTQTLFDNGRRQAQVDLSEAVCKELAETYLQAVLTSLQEAQDSLVATVNNRDTALLLVDTAQQARESLRLSRLRYEQGADDLLAVLESQSTLLSAEDSLVQAQLARFLAAVNLYKALGGGAPES